MQNNFNKTIKKSIEDGNIALLKSDGSPITEDVWGIWFFDGEQYGILFKTFSSIEENVLLNLYKVRGSFKNITFGILKINMYGGCWKFIRVEE